MNTFEKLYSIPVHDKVEKKGNLDYLSWANAWAMLKKLHPDAQRTVYEDAGMVCLLSMQNSVIPPTINLVNKDEDCDLNYTPNKSINKEVNISMSNSFGFGGHNGVLVFSKE